ncbi:MAG: penicillin acylase family protein [Desulfobacteraceae bacterium]|nr:MAG: penicillin acylase family protein [Desulfobacteraceae bacterium]
MVIAMKKLVIALGVLVIGIIAFYTAFQVFFRMAVPVYTGKILIDGLKTKVEVRTDDYGVPHIFAENADDLFFAQGYITARERLFQMELTRLAGQGELSTLFGEQAVKKDKFFKTIGFQRLSKEGYRALSKESRAAVDAYAAGVNAYIEGKEPLSREFIILRAKPGKWSGEDCVATALLMGFSLTRSLYVDLVLYRIAEHAGEEIAYRLAPSYPDFAPTLTGKRLSPVPLGTLKSQFHRFPADALKTGALMDLFQPEIPASNFMIFSGKMTESGKALFAGSPDLKPTLPALFFMMRIKGGDYDVAGGALPGLPGIGPLGYNGYIAWSAVNGRGDELDYFVEKVDPENPDQYLTEEGYRDFTVVNETLRIKVKGGGLREEKYPVKVSRHGPIISEVMPMAPSNCAMKWATFDNASTDVEGLLLLNRARNFSEFRSALSRIKTNNLGLGYADKEGNIGWQFTASAPVRKKGDGTFPVPAWTGEFEWTGYVPYEELPYDYNPDSGYVASFNNEPGNVSYHLTNYYLFERAMRFDQIIRARSGKKTSLKDLNDMQLDTISIVAERWVPLVSAACGDGEFERYSRLLKEWNFSSDIKSPAATLFNTFYAHMMKSTLADEVGEKLWQEGLSQSYLLYIPDLVLTRIASISDHELYDDISTKEVKEQRDDIVLKSMKAAVGQLNEQQGGNPEKWRWGRGHKMFFEHPLGSKLGFLNLASIPTNGDHFTINSGFWELGNPFKMDSGGVIRILVDFADPEKSTIISPPGQSGHYKSRHYDDLAQLWADGGQIPLRFVSGKNIARLLMLEPAGF